MIANARFPLRRLSTLLAAVALLIFGAVDAARAQDPFGDFFQGLFGRQRYQQQHRPPSPNQNQRMRRLVPHGDYAAPSYWRGQQRAAKKTKTPKPDNPNAPAFTVAVIGDTLGQQLADGLEEAFADRAEIRILHKGKESSGLVREDFYDWPKAARELAGGGEKIDMAVVMLGSNDRQAIHDNSETLEPPLSPRWRERYAQRVDAIRAIFREKKIPLVWVGLPVTKSEHFSADMAKLNDIYRQSAMLDSAPFVDIWEAFADERNQYQAFGPDINGRIVKLRAGDGVHFTDVGARKVAHFVEGEIKRLFDAARPGGEPATPAPAEAAQPPQQEGPQQQETVAAPVPSIVAPGEPTPAAAPTLPERPAIGPVQPLTSWSSQGDGELARRDTAATPNADARAAAARALVEHVYVEGGDQPSHPGRADDFAWPKGEKKKAAEPN